MDLPRKPYKPSYALFLRDISGMSSTGRARSTVMLSHISHVYSVAFSPDSRMLASASRDSAVRVWDVADKREVYSLKGHRGAVFSVACASDGRRALSGGADRTVRLWELPG